MQLTRHTDYALRVLMYLGLHPGELVTISEISAAYGISRGGFAALHGRTPAACILLAAARLGCGPP